MKEIDALVADALANLVGGKNQHEQAIRAALMEARALGLEEAAKVCDQIGEQLMSVVGESCAHRIRALKGE